MAYPYTNTTSGLAAVIHQLRSTFPATVNATTLKKWSIASNNEGTVLGVLRFLGIIDEQGARQPEAVQIFSAHNDSEFADKFAGLVSNAYSELFAHFGEHAWTLDLDRLISFFRAEDKTSGVVGKRQAQTFRVLSGLTGHAPAAVARADEGEGRRVPRVRPPRTDVARSGKARVVATANEGEVVHHASAIAANGGPNVTVRIELNLPVTEKREVYDLIFSSIRANLF